ncbi:MAG TPA: hypothetical protein VK137_17890 [Planctomycetaceae bacterium]|nr:hypothetical protein [Planctomycetaceae bacterium]
MPITVSCGSCGKSYRVPDDAAGKKMKCKDCGTLVSIPVKATPGIAAVEKTPVPKKAPKRELSEENPYHDLSENDDLPEDDDVLEQAPRSRRQAAGKVSGGKKSKSRGSRESSGETSWLKKAGGVLGGLVVILVIVVKVVRIAGVGGGSVSWQEFSPPTGQFRVQFPASPQTSSKVDGGITSHTWQARSARFLCVLEYAHVPAALDAPGVREGAFNGFLTTIRSEKPSARVTRQADSQFRSFPVREFDLEYENTRNVSRVHLLGEHLYILQFVGPQSRFDVDAMSRYFNSFDPVVGPVAAADGMRASPAVPAPSSVPATSSLPSSTPSMPLTGSATPPPQNSATQIPPPTGLPVPPVTPDPAYHRQQAEQLEAKADTDPQGARTFLQLAARSWTQAGNKERALAALRKLEKLGPEGTDDTPVFIWYQTLGKAYADAGDVESAVRIWQTGQGVLKNAVFAQQLQRRIDQAKVSKGN